MLHDTAVDTFETTKVFLNIPECPNWRFSPKIFPKNRSDSRRPVVRGRGQQPFSAVLWRGRRESVAPVRLQCADCAEPRLRGPSPLLFRGDLLAPHAPLRARIFLGARSMEEQAGRASAPAESRSRAPSRTLGGAWRTASGRLRFFASPHASSASLT